MRVLGFPFGVETARLCKYLYRERERGYYYDKLTGTYSDDPRAFERERCPLWRPTGEWRTYALALVGYESIEFLAPLYAGDFVEAVGRITRVGSTSRRMEFECRKVIAARPDISDSAADVLEAPIIIGRALGTTVVKTERQRKSRTAQ